MRKLNDLQSRSPLIGDMPGIFQLLRVSKILFKVVLSSSFSSKKCRRYTFLEVEMNGYSIPLSALGRSQHLSFINCEHFNFGLFEQNPKFHRSIRRLENKT